MKLAYLITAYDNPVHLNRLIESISDSDSEIFIHIDKKSPYTFSLPKNNNVHQLSNNIKVFWGGFSMVEAILNLIDTAQKEASFDYYYLISGSDYPIRSKKYIKEFFKKNNGKEFLNICKMPENGKDFYRTDYYFMETDQSKSLAARIKNTLNGLIKTLKIKRKFPAQYSHLTLYGGSTWWALSKDAIKYIQLFIQNNPDFVSFYRNVFIPEELFFQTILGNSPFMKNIVNAPTFADWSIPNTAHPQKMNENLINLLHNKVLPSTYGNKKMEALFARKFADDSKALLDLIDKELRK